MDTRTNEKLHTLHPPYDTPTLTLLLLLTLNSFFIPSLRPNGASKRSIPLLSLPPDVRVQGESCSAEKW